MFSKHLYKSESSPSGVTSVWVANISHKKKTFQQIRPDEFLLFVCLVFNLEGVLVKEGRDPVVLLQEMSLLFIIVNLKAECCSL